MCGGGGNVVGRGSSRRALRVTWAKPCQGIYYSVSDTQFAGAHCWVCVSDIRVWCLVEIPAQGSEFFLLLLLNFLFCLWPDKRVVSNTLSVYCCSSRLDTSICHIQPQRKIVHLYSSTYTVRAETRMPFEKLFRGKVLLLAKDKMQSLPYSFEDFRWHVVFLRFLSILLNGFMKSSAR